MHDMHLGAVMRVFIRALLRRAVWMSCPIHIRRNPSPRSTPMRGRSTPDEIADRADDLALLVVDAQQRLYGR
jgi:hypothetical protein